MSHYSLRECSACHGQGMLLLMECPHCRAVLAVCDECDLIWSDVARIAVELNAPADGTFPKCSECSKIIPPKSYASLKQIERAFPGVSPRLI